MPSARALSRGSRPSDDQLLDSARTVFARRGFDTASMEAVARTARCTKPTLYAHFGSKQRLYLAALGREAGILRDWLFAAYDDASGKAMRDQVHACMAAIFTYAEANPEGFRLLFATEAPGHAGVLDTLWASVIDRIDGVIRAYLHERGLPDGGYTQTMAASAVGAAAFSVRHAYLATAAAATPAQTLAIVASYTDAAFRHFDPAAIALEG